MKKYKPFEAKEHSHLLLGLFFSMIKVIFVLLALTVGALLVGQSSVAPVSTRLLASYGMEYAVSTFKPYRHLFPQPYLIDLEKNRKR